MAKLWPAPGWIGGSRPISFGEACRPGSGHNKDLIRLRSVLACGDCVCASASRQNAGRLKAGLYLDTQSLRETHRECFGARMLFLFNEQAAGYALRQPWLEMRRARRIARWSMAT